MPNTSTSLPRTATSPDAAARRVSIWRRLEMRELRAEAPHPLQVHVAAVRDPSADDLKAAHVQCAERVECPVADLQRGQVRQKVVANEAAEKDEVVDDALEAVLAKGGYLEELEGSPCTLSAAAFRGRRGWLRSRPRVFP
eukprot:5924722-Prymnesium_polylepis.1